jgi:PAS domain S-box-containing protein
LKSGIPGLVAMNPVTALAFIFAGLSLWMLRVDPGAPSHRPMARLFAVLVILLALLCLSRLYTPWDLGPDRLLFGSEVNGVARGLPNRMAPNTALNFLLVGSALLALNYRTRTGRFPAHGFALIAAALAFTALVGYAFQSSLLYGIGAFIPMAVNTAVGFLILAGGVLCSRPAHGVVAVILSGEAGGLLARRLLPAAVLVPLVLAWLRLRGEQAGLYDSAGGVALLTTATILIAGVLISRSATSLNWADVARRQAEDKLRVLNEQLETRVRERTEELRTLFEESPLALCSVTTDGNVRSWNRAAEQLFGWTATEVIGGLLPIVPPDRLEEYVRLRSQALAGHPTNGFETTCVRKDGAPVDVSVSTAALHDASGGVCGVIAVYADIRSRRALEAQLRQSQKMEAVGRLAGGVAHDFNNLLTVIRTGAEFLLADLATDDARRADAVEISNAATRAAALTRQLLAFSRQQMLQLRVVDLNTLIGELEPMLHRLVEEHIAVVTSLAPDLDRVKADPHQLEQVLLNLVVNARDAMPSGGTILIETANVELDAQYPHSHLEAQAGPHVVLTVTDSGCGMDAATQARAFEPFFTTKGAGHGTGLGLATVYGIVKQSGGHIWVYSEIDRGTTFKIYLPQC